MAEQMLFNKDGVSVSKERFVWEGQTVAMQGVTSIQNLEEKPKKTGPIVVMVIGAIVALIGLGTISSGVGGVVTLLIGAGLIALGILWLKSLKSEHWVVLRTAGVEQRSLHSKDAGRVNEIVEALNNAIVARG